MNPSLQETPRPEPDPHRWLGLFAALAAPPYAERGAVTDEYLRLFRTLWESDGSLSFDGSYVHLDGVQFAPPPAQRPLPLWVGGNGPAALRRAAALGDGWYGVGHTPETVVSQAAKLRAHLAEAGRADAPFEMTLSHKGKLTRDDLRRYEDAGIHRVVSLPWTRGREADEGLQRLADEVL